MGRDQTERLLTQADFSSSEEVAGQEHRCQSRYNLSASPGVLLGRTAGLEVSATLRDLHSLSFLSCKLNL